MSSWVVILFGDEEAIARATEEEGHVLDGNAGGQEHDQEARQVVGCGEVHHDVCAQDRHQGGGVGQEVCAGDGGHGRGDVQWEQDSGVPRGRVQHLVQQVEDRSRNWSQYGMEDGFNTEFRKIVHARRKRKLVPGLVNNSVDKYVIKSSSPRF